MEGVTPYAYLLIGGASGRDGRGALSISIANIGGGNALINIGMGFFEMQPGVTISLPGDLGGNYYLNQDIELDSAASTLLIVKTMPEKQLH